MYGLSTKKHQFFPEFTFEVVEFPGKAGARPQLLLELELLELAPLLVVMLLLQEVQLEFKLNIYQQQFRIEIYKDFFIELINPSFILYGCLLSLLFDKSVQQKSLR